jgi:hypothetical protein
MTLDIAEAWAIHLDTFGGSYVVGNEGGVRLSPFGYFRSIGDLDLDATADLGAFGFRQQTVGRARRRVRLVAAPLDRGPPGPRAARPHGGRRR